MLDMEPNRMLEKRLEDNGQHWRQQDLCSGDRSASHRTDRVVREMGKVEGWLACWPTGVSRRGMVPAGNAAVSTDTAAY